MSMNLETGKVEEKTEKEVWSVRDFVKRHRLDEAEEQRLTALFGAFATKGELLYNCRRPPVFR